MFNNFVTNNSYLLISGDGCKDKQNITTVDLIKNCKMKKRTLDQSCKDVDPLKIFKPENTLLEQNIKGYHVKDKDTIYNSNIGGGENVQNQIPGSSTKGIEAKDILDPKYGRKKRVSIMVTDEMFQNGYLKLDHDSGKITESGVDLSQPHKKYLSEQDKLQEEKQILLVLPETLCQLLLGCGGAVWLTGCLVWKCSTAFRMVTCFFSSIFCPNHKVK